MGRKKADSTQAEQSQEQPKIMTSFGGASSSPSTSVHDEVLAALTKSLGAESKVEEKSKTVLLSSTSSQIPMGNIDLKGSRRLSDEEQRDISLIDPYVSAIISTRVAQCIPIGRPSESKFDRGCRVIDLDPPKKNDFQNQEEFKKSNEIRKKQAASILEWALACGTKDEEILDEVFRDADKVFKRMNLHQFFACQARNLLTFGRCATNIIRDREGNPILFRPVPVDTIYRITDGEDIHLNCGDNTTEQAQEDAEEYNAIPEKEKPLAYVQRFEGRNVAFFTEDELKIWHYQDQAISNLNGYPLSPIEQTLYMIYIHQQTLQYMKNAFVKGLASKGMIVIESTVESNKFSQQDLERFREEFHNFVSRNDNSATTPVLAGHIRANFVPLNATPEDMQFLQIEDHVIRALCASFQIAPQELLQSTLGSMAQGGLNASGKETELISSQERGLRILLDVMFDGVNEIIGTNFPSFKKNFAMTYCGIGADTKESVLQQAAAELQTTATMSSLWAMSEKTDSFPWGGDVPLAQAFWAGPARCMTFGEIREHFFGDKGASQKPEYQFLIDPTLNQMMQQLKVTPIEQQAEMSQMQMQAQEQQMTAQAQQTAQPGQPGDQQGQPQDQGQQPPPQEQDPNQQPQEQQPSLRDVYEKSTMKKSIDSYFRAWMEVHE